MPYTMSPEEAAEEENEEQAPAGGPTSPQEVFDNLPGAIVFFKKKGDIEE